MFLTEYDEEKAMRLFYKDGVEDGMERAKAHAAKVMAEKFNIPIEEFYAAVNEE